MGSGSILKVIRVNTRRLYLVFLIFAIGYHKVSVGQDNPAVPLNGTSVKVELDPQLKVNKEALLKGSVDAATVMLFHDDPKARGILLDALRQSENSPARIAVCKALIQARVLKKTVKDDQDFIEPLLGVLATNIDAEAQLAAEATLIFDYQKIKVSLEKIVYDASKPVKTRLNIIHALKLQPDKTATILLLRLVDIYDTEKQPAAKQVATEAESALHSLGIPVGEGPETRRQIIYELKLKNRDEFLRDWLIHQEVQMREMRDELKLWRDSFITALDTIYNAISDDTARGKFLAVHLTNDKAVVRLWALEKAYKWRLATGPKLPEQLGPILIDLISDSDRDVRLKTAQLLAFMVELNSAPRLLAQLEAEQDERVKMELFIALGGACSEALRPRSPVEISPEIKQIRNKTLEWADKFLSQEDIEKAKNGAEVIKKLLERDGLKSEEVDKYLGLLSKRYSEQKDKPDGTLRGELLNAMAGLCAQDSTCRDKAAKLFQPIFKDALRDETYFVRETAVDGLAYIDKASTLKMLRKDYVNDPSEKLREKLIKLADEVGGQEDLNWLAEKIGANSESEPAWQAMIKIFNGSNTDDLKEWIERLTAQNSKIKLSNEQKIAFLEIVQNTAVRENKPEMLKNVREKLPELYCKIGKVERAAELVQNFLTEGDLDPNDVVVKSIDNYLREPPAGVDPNAVIEALSGIKTPQSRPKWNKWLRVWVVRRDKAQKPEKPEQTSNKPE